MERKVWVKTQTQMILPNDCDVFCLSAMWGYIGWILALPFGIQHSANSPTVSLEQPELAFCQNDNLHKVKCLTSTCERWEAVVSTCFPELGGFGQFMG